MTVAVASLTPKFCLRYGTKCYREGSFESDTPELRTLITKPLGVL